MIKGIEDGRIKEVYFDDGGYFRTKLTYQQVLDKLSYVFETEQYTEAINAGVTDPEILADLQVPVKTTSADVLEYRIKELGTLTNVKVKMKYRLLE